MFFVLECMWRGKSGKVNRREAKKTVCALFRGGKKGEGEEKGEKTTTNNTKKNICLSNKIIGESLACLACFFLLSLSFGPSMKCWNAPTMKNK